MAGFLPLSLASAQEADMMKKTLSAFTVMAALAGSLLAPVAARAQGVELKFYDRSHKDYHQWNGDEDRYYHQYLDTNHRKYREFSKMNKKDQQAYWKWRHDHGDR
jgi:hypothetical protein